MATTFTLLQQPITPTEACAFMITDRSHQQPTLKGSGHGQQLREDRHLTTTEGTGYRERYLPQKIAKFIRETEMLII